MIVTENKVQLPGSSAPLKEQVTGLVACCPALLVRRPRRRNWFYGIEEGWQM